MKQLLKVDFHCHTDFSPDGLISPKSLVERLERVGLDRVAITDHDTIRGALAVKALAPERVIVGEEIQTQKGELLAFYVQEEIPGGLPVEEAIRLLRQQGAFISVSHPFDPYRSGWREADVLDLAAQVDAIEVYNARCLRASYNRQAEAFARRHQILGMAGSDAHTLAEVGGVVMHLPHFEDAEGLRQALRQARIESRLSPFWVHFSSIFAALRNKARRTP